MKSMKYLLAISLAILPILADACWDPSTIYNSSSLFRLDEDKEYTRSMREANCREWQMMTDVNIPIEDIEYVVYEMSIDEYEAFCAQQVCMIDNAFAQWIKRNNPEIVEFLLLAKRNEEIRFKYSSKWYYPTMKVGGPMTLEDVVEYSLNADEGALRERYLLQALRALNTLGRYQECLDLWNTEISLLPEDNLMRQHMLPLVASAYYHTGDVEKAMEFYASFGDVSSMYYIANLEDRKLTKFDIIEYSYRGGAKLAHFQKHIKNMVVGAETYPNVVEEGDRPVVSEDLIALRDLAVAAGNDAKCADRAEWLYIAAYIYSQQGLYAQAQNLIAKAERLPLSATLKDSIKVLSIYIEAQTTSCDASYDARLYDHIMWLEMKVKQDVEDNRIFSWYLWDNFSYSYWYSALSRICNNVLAPRYMAKGDTSRALQLMNYTENFRYSVVPYIEYYYSTNDDFYTAIHSIGDYRRNSVAFNHLDYSNRFFNTIDKQTPDVAIAYVGRVKNPVSKLDTHLNSIGYTSNDYLYDIVGTLCLRYMRYEEAAYYLSLVSLEYEDMLNLNLTRDPFVALNEERDDFKDFRYRFASTMVSLEQGIESATDPNRRAQMLLRYGIGMANSVNNCWPLTHYGRSCTNPWDDDPITQEVSTRGINCINEALCTFTNDEHIAQAHYALGHFRTVAVEYGYTEAGAYVKRHCDNYIDYTPPLYTRH